MRFFSIFAAVAVAFVLYFTIVDREAVQAILGEQDAPASDVDSAGEAVAAGGTGDGLVRVVVRTSQARRIDTAIPLRGETLAAREVDVLSETAAVVVSEPLRKGQKVEPGQVLCRLDEGARGAALAQARAQLDEARARVPEAEARLEQARAQLNEAEINQNASARLSEGGFASATRVANAEANVATARAAVSSAQAGLSAAQSTIETAAAAVVSAEKEVEKLTITAPFGGLLESDTAELGALLQPGALCATVIQLDPIKLVAFIPETEVSRVRVGAPARATLATGEGDISGHVTFLSRAADETTRTFRVEIEVENSDQAISDGQTAEILIEGEGAQAHLLPQSALTLNDEGVLGIRAIDAQNVVEFHPVRLLRDTPSGVWVVGLPDRVDVIVLGQEYVVAGVTVLPTYEELGQ